MTEQVDTATLPEGLIYPYGTPAERVERGLALLRETPWLDPDRIDGSRLNMLDPRACVLAQASGRDYFDAIRTLAIERSGPPTDGMPSWDSSDLIDRERALAQSHGLCCSVDSVQGADVSWSTLSTAREQDADALEAAWLQALAAG